ncbi:putative ATP-grasp-modified RiPP [Streptomyces sp. NPDC002668]|uniref:putative ATP-grasp-modified RiPP n=1 Tax=Streptomyces sp. NPDC002668 TaxID=3154422 RepID=UPI003321735E
MTTVTIPFAARAAAPPCLVTTSIDGVRWDADRQINVAADGTPWHTLPQAASSTDTNQDGKGDEVSDPYRASAS